jgi:hypothetical protein
MSLIDVLTGNISINPPIQMTTLSTVEYYAITASLIGLLIFLTFFESKRLYHEFIKAS